MSCDGVAIVTDAPVQPPGGASSLAGRAGIYVASGSTVNVTSFTIEDGWLPAPQPLPLLASDAMTGAGNLASGWRIDTQESVWRFGDGIVCDAAANCEHAAKWNFVGVSVLLWAPRGIPGAGNASVSVDGGEPMSIDLSAPTLVPSAVVWASGTLTAGRHAFTVRTAPGITLPVDSVDIRVEAVGGAP